MLRYSQTSTNSSHSYSSKNSSNRSYVDSAYSDSNSKPAGSPRNRPYQLKTNLSSSPIAYQSPKMSQSNLPSNSYPNSGRYGGSRPMNMSNPSGRNYRSNSNASSSASSYNSSKMVSPRLQTVPSPINHTSNNMNPISMDIKNGNLPPKKIIKAIRSYTTNNAPKELSFKEGDFFFVIQELENFYLVCNPLEKTQGLVPRDCFDEVEKKKNAINIDDTNVNNGGKPSLPLPKRQASRMNHPNNSYNENDNNNFGGRNSSDRYSDRSNSSNDYNRARSRERQYDNRERDYSRSRSQGRYNNDNRDRRNYDRDYRDNYDRYNNSEKRYSPNTRYERDNYYDDRRDYGRNYDRDYDRNYGRNDYDRGYDRDYNRDYDRRYDRDYRDDYNRDYNRRNDYNRDYDRNYDKDYSRNYDRGYERNYRDKSNSYDDNKYNDKKNSDDYEKGYDSEKDTNKYTDVESDYDIELEDQIKALNIKTFEMENFNGNSDAKKPSQEKRRVIGLSERVITAIVRSNSKKYDENDNEEIVYQLEVFKGDGQCYILYRTYNDFQKLIFSLIDQFPVEAGLEGQSKRVLPYLLPKEHINQGILDSFLQYLVQQSQDVQSSNVFIDFFCVHGKHKNRSGNTSDSEEESYYSEYEDEENDHVMEESRNFSFFFDTKEDDTKSSYNSEKESVKVKFVCGKDIFAVRVNNTISYDVLMNKAENCILNTENDSFIERISYSNEFGTDTKLYGNDDLKMLMKLSYPKLIFYINKK